MKSRFGIELERGQIVGGHFQKHPARATAMGFHAGGLDERTREAGAARVGARAKGEDFALIRRNADEDEGARVAAAMSANVNESRKKAVKAVSSQASSKHCA